VQPVEQPKQPKQPVTETCVQCGKPFTYTPGDGPRRKMCSPECVRKRKMAKTVEARAGKTPQDCPPDKHGTAVGATYYGCKCTKCSTWQRQAKAKWRKAQAQAETT
jgi:hypothetical protein